MMRTDRHSNGRGEGRKDRRPLDGCDDRKGDHHSKNAHLHSERKLDELRRGHNYHDHRDRTLRASREEAISALFKATQDALTFLSRFKDDFDREVRDVQAYASPEVIDHLWINKVRISNGHRGPRAPSAQSQDREDREPPKSNFKSVAKGLDQSLHSAILASRSNPDPTIVRKLHHADNDIGALFRDVAEDFGLLDGLTTELEMLAIFLQRNGARAGSRGDSKHCPESSQKQSGRREDSRRGQQSDGNEDYHCSNNADGDEDRDGRRSREGSEACDGSRGQEDHQDTEYQEEPEVDGNSGEGIIWGLPPCIPADERLILDRWGLVMSYDGWEASGKFIPYVGATSARQTRPFYPYVSIERPLKS